MKFERVVIFESVLVTLIGVIVLAGWTLDIESLKSVWPGFITMKANTAVCLILLAICAYTFRHEIYNKKIIGLVFILCTITMGISALTLFEYLFKINFGLDELLFLDKAGLSGRFPPGRLAPVTAISFILLSTSLLLQNGLERRFYFASQFLAILVFFMGLQSVFGYLLGMSYVFGSAFYTQMAVHTALSLILLSSALLFSRSNEGFSKAFAGNSTTSSIARRLLFAVTFVPPLTRIFSRQGFLSGLYDQDFELLIQVMVSIVVSTLIVLLAAKALFETEQKRILALTHEKLARQQAESAVQIRDQFLMIASHEFKTPLMALSMQNELVQAQLANQDPALLKPERIKKIFETSRRQINWLTNLTNDMLNVSKISSGRIELKIEQHDLLELAHQFWLVKKISLRPAVLQWTALATPRWFLVMRPVSNKLLQIC